MKEMKESQKSQESKLESFEKSQNSRLESIEKILLEMKKEK